MCTSHGVQELGDLVDTLPLSGRRKLGWEAKFAHNRQSGCRERSFGWVSCHLHCFTPFHVVSRRCTMCCAASTFIHLLSSADAHCRPSVSIWLYVPHRSDFFFFFFSPLRELYVAMLRIVQLAFSIKPCPLSQIRLTAQTSLYNEWNMECTADFYPVSLCRWWQTGMCSPNYRHNFSKHT